MVSRYKDITGKRFGSLVATNYEYTENRLAFWKFKCDCGNDHIARANTVTYVAKNKPNTVFPSCGCKELANKTKHGFRKSKDTHPAYSAWKAIKDRCYNPKVNTYINYGAKGVTMCDEWLNDPSAFVEWSLANGWKKGLVIDKDILSKKLGINPPIYSPETCQWITEKENVSYATNRSNYGSHPNIKLSQEQVELIIDLYFSGKETNKSKLARMFNVKSSSTIDRLVKQHTRVTT